MAVVMAMVAGRRRRWRAMRKVEVRLGGARLARRGLGLTFAGTAPTDPHRIPRRHDRLRPGSAPPARPTRSRTLLVTDLQRRPRRPRLWLPSAQLDPAMVRSERSGAGGTALRDARARDWGASLLR